MTRIIVLIFLLACNVYSQHPTNPHEHGSSKHAEHQAMLNLVDPTEATHIATRSGSWFSPETWGTAGIPGNNSRVLIPENIEITYDAVSDSRIFTIRVDGVLSFSRTSSSKLVVDTLISNTMGTLLVGTKENPIPGNIQVEIVIANNGDIDTNWDPLLLSRGIITHGKTRMHGEEKTVHMKVKNDPEAGNSTLTMKADPKNWRVGDKLVVAGTSYRRPGPENSDTPKLDVVTVIGVSGNQVSISPPLNFSYSTPRQDLKTSVANYTRNIRISSESGQSSQVHHRGHLMFMHSDDVDVRFIEASELGRTDKSVQARDTEKWDEISPNTNVKGRYSIHLHRTGLSDKRNPALLIGNAVFGSPGWGFVHHDSNAVLHNNATYNTFGAAYVAESANETGAWTENIAIYSKGFSWGSPKAAGTGGEFFDTARSGDGFFFQGRLVRSVGNIAANVNTGFTYFHRGFIGGVGMIALSDKDVHLPEVLAHRSTGAFPDTMPVRSFFDNETFASRSGGHVARSGFPQGHDVQSRFVNLKAWNVWNGFSVEYTQHYVLDNFDIIGYPELTSHHHNSGISIGRSTDDINIINPKIKNFLWGVKFSQPSTNERNRRQNLISPAFQNVNEPIVGLIEGLDQKFDSFSELPETTPSLNLPHFINTDDSASFSLQGVKIDSLGSTPIGYNDGRAFTIHSFIWYMREKGYFVNAAGDNYYGFTYWYSDRLTGKSLRFSSPHKLTRLQTNDAQFLGEMELSSEPPVVTSESLSVTKNQDLKIDVLANDTAPNGHKLIVDGVEQPKYGTVFKNDDGTLTYRPDIDRLGLDSFTYWVSDRVGNVVPATVSLEVIDLNDLPRPKNLAILSPQ